MYILCIIRGEKIIITADVHQYANINITGPSFIYTHIIVHIPQRCCSVTRKSYMNIIYVYMLLCTRMRIVSSSSLFVQARYNNILYMAVYVIIT